MHKNWKSIIHRVLLEIIVALLVVLWLYTAINKYFDFQNFKTQLGRSPFIESISGFVALTLPSGELMLAILLVFKRTRAIGLYLSFALMLLFTGYVYIMLYYAYALPCSCGGVLSQLSWRDHLIFNILFSALALIGILLIEIRNNIAKQSLSYSLNNMK